MTSEYGYFVLRLHRPNPEVPAPYRGVIERLGTGETRAFENAEELLRLLSSWPPAGSKMPGDETPGNTSRSGA
jgi:hypothetical protein